MEPMSLSEQLRAGFLQVVRPEVVAALAPDDVYIGEVCVADLPAAVRVGTPQDVRDKLWIAALVRYRTRSKSFWGPVILEMLAPALIQELAQLRALRPYLEEEDLTQQLLLAALEAAACIPLRGRRRFIEQRLARRAATSIKRALEYEARRRRWSLPVSERAVDRRAIEDWHAKQAESIYIPRRKRGHGRGRTSDGYRGEIGNA